MCLKGSSVTWPLQKIKQSCRGPTKPHKETKKLISYIFQSSCCWILCKKIMGGITCLRPQACFPIIHRVGNAILSPSKALSLTLVRLVQSTNNEVWLVLLIQQTQTHIHTVLSSTSTHQLYITNTAGEYIPACLHTPEGGICFSSQAPGHCEPWQLLPQ